MRREVEPASGLRRDGKEYLLSWSVPDPPLVVLNKDDTVASRSSRRRPCILTVDDGPDIREAMGEAIASWQCAALPAASGQEALDLLEHRRVDVVLCDVVMPGIDGAETLREIKQRAPDLPVIMMSAMMTPDLRRHLWAMGAQVCLVKPIGRKELALALFPWCFPARPSS